MITSVTDQIRFPTASLPVNLEPLRLEIRDFLERELAAVSPVIRSHSWEAYDAEFSAKLGANGWIGMTLPKKYGGHGRSFFERYVLAFFQYVGALLISTYRYLFI